MQDANTRGKKRAAELPVPRGRWEGTSGAPVPRLSGARRWAQRDPENHDGCGRRTEPGPARLALTRSARPAAPGRARTAPAARPAPPRRQRSAPQLRKAPVSGLPAPPLPPARPAPRARWIRAGRSPRRAPPWQRSVSRRLRAGHGRGAAPAAAPPAGGRPPPPVPVTCTAGAAATGRAPGMGGTCGSAGFPPGYPAPRFPPRGGEDTGQDRGWSPRPRNPGGGADSARSRPFVPAPGFDWLRALLIYMWRGAGREGPGSKCRAAAAAPWPPLGRERRRRTRSATGGERGWG